MKKIIVSICFVVMCLLAQSCHDNKKTEAVAVPEVVMTAFSTKYPSAADVNWKSEYKDGKTIYIGEFKMNGTKKEADFDESGSFLAEK
jgi:hypothetical protein